MNNLKTPYYVFDEEGFIKNYKRLQESMKSVYPKYEISYSYKTNYIPYICKLVKKLGGYAEVVSDMELTLAKKIGYSNDKIVYNGPAKGDLLEEHLENGGIVNIDNLEETTRIINYAKKNQNKIYKVGIRVNLNITDKFISRFGLCDNELDECVYRLKSVINIKIVGLHVHISRNRDLVSWLKRAKHMCELADRYICGVPDYISLGSGMYGDMPEFLKKQFGNVPSYEEYANSLMSVFADKYGLKDGPIVFTEPGTTVVSRYISFYTTILNIKEVRGRNIATTDGCFEQLGEICKLKKLPINVDDSNGNYYESIDIMGYTCLEQDLMFEKYCGKVNVGDVIRFDNVGGYSIVFKPQFIRPNCNTYVLHKDESMEEIMRKETFDDIFDKYTF